jgi:hypothetical protein
MLSTAMIRDIVHGEWPCKRIITKTRKEQNRVAAKAYRKPSLFEIIAISK